MTTKNIIEELDKLPLTDKIYVIEETLKKIRTIKENNLEAAVNLLFEDYQSDEELTAFTTLDKESFYEPR